MNPILTYDPGDGRTILREGRGGSLVKLSDYEALEKRLAVVQAELEAAFPDPKDDVLAAIPSDFAQKVLEAEKAMRGVPSQIIPEANRDARNAQGTYSKAAEDEVIYHNTALAMYEKTPEAMD